MWLPPRMMLIAQKRGGNSRLGLHNPVINVASQFSATREYLNSRLVKPGGSAIHVQHTGRWPPPYSETGILRTTASVLKVFVFPGIPFAREIQRFLLLLTL